MVPALRNEVLRESALTALQIAGERMGTSSDLIVYANAESGGWEQELLLQHGTRSSSARSTGREHFSEIEAKCLQALGSFRDSLDLERLQQGLIALPREL